MKRFLLFLIPFILISVFFVFHIKFYVNAEVYIKKGSSIKEIAYNLKEKDIIFSKELFLIYSYLRNQSLKAGFYKFKGKYSISDIWYKLYKGNESLIEISIVPGDDLFSIAKKLEKNGVVKRKKFIKLAFNEKFLKKIGLSYKSFEGFIYPDNYYLPKNMDTEKLFKYFLKRFKNEYKISDINDKKFYKKMIIASLLEKETNNLYEKRVIAGIIYKRLKIRMPLQIDATVIYAKKLLNKNYKKISKKDYKTNNSFNTYIIYGLPPAPISTFSKESLMAANNPIKTDYLYYFTKDQKKHIFSKTYKEHLKKLKGVQ